MRLRQLNRADRRISFGMARFASGHPGRYFGIAAMPASRSLNVSEKGAEAESGCCGVFSEVCPGALHTPAPLTVFLVSSQSQPTEDIPAAASSCLELSQVSISSRRHLFKPIRTTGLGKSSCRIMRQRVERDIFMKSIMSRCLIRLPMVSPPFRILLIPE